jgi:hypothetical protein
MSCKTRMFNSCIISGESLPFSFNWTHEFSNRWNPNTAYAAAVAVRPSMPELQTGLEYESSGGQSGPEEPQWPTVVGDTVTDGDITWTAAPISNASLRERVDTDNWPAVTDFTITPDAPIDEPGRQVTQAQIGSEVVIRTRRQIRCEVTTTEGNDYVGIIKMKVE